MSLIYQKLEDLNPTKIANYINGEFTESLNYIESENPSTGKTHVLVPDSTINDAKHAIDSAYTALNNDSWSKLKAPARSNILNQLANLLESNQQIFANCESQDQGKLANYAFNADIGMSISCLRSWAKKITLKNEELMVRHDLLDGEAINYTYKSPVGVSVIIMPWNFPLFMVIKRFAPCIAYGNTCIVKPSEYTSLTTFLFAQLCNQVESLPKGVANFIFGKGQTLGKALCQDDTRVRAVAFTGSSATGKIIANYCSHTLKKVALECGGKNPAIFFKDVEIDEATDFMCKAAFTNNGEICLCMERCYVEKSIYDQFLKIFIEKTKKFWKVGHATNIDQNDPHKIGPLCGKFHYKKVTNMLKEAVRNGAKIETGYLGPDYNDFKKSMPHVFSDKDIEIQNFENEPEILKNGNYFPPTIISNVNHNFEIMQEEVFGPITCIMPFETVSEAIALANDTNYGLGACVFTENLNIAHRVAQKIEAGTVWVNNFLFVSPFMPFGGFKESGVGRDSDIGFEEFYTEVRNVSLRIKS